MSGENFVVLSNGQKMPNVGLGTWLNEKKEEVEIALNVAFDAGYRHFDTAYIYKNEAIIGDIISGWIASGKVTREELFITTKLPTIGIDASRVEHFLRKSLEALKLDYVDLYLIHHAIGSKYKDDQTLFPFEDGKLAIDLTTDHVKVWGAMEAQVKAGRAKAIGVSNFNSTQIERIVKSAEILPANLQVEAHIYFQQKELRETCKKHGITFTAYAPLGSPNRDDKFKPKTPAVLSILQKDPVVEAIATRHGKTPSQILIKFLIQHGLVAIPKSINPEHLRENFKVFDFTLSDTDLKELEALDQGNSGRTFKPATFPGAELHPECPF